MNLLDECMCCTGVPMLVLLNPVIPTPAAIGCVVSTLVATCISGACKSNLSPDMLTYHENIMQVGHMNLLCTLPVNLMLSGAASAAVPIYGQLGCIACTSLSYMAAHYHYGCPSRNASPQFPICNDVASALPPAEINRASVIEACVMFRAPPDECEKSKIM
jgi:hypothetical protein